MKVKIKRLKKYLKDNGLTKEELACDMGVSAAEVEKMLNGQTVGVNTARKFIAFFGADDAQSLIDWEAIGKKNPLACEADTETEDEDDFEDFDEDDAEHEYRALNYDPNCGSVEELIDLEDRYRG
jgi:transcriptional regulator with XRE-family HTH domain